MTVIERQIVVQNDGEVQLNQLPCRRGDLVTARLVIDGSAGSDDARKAALERFLELARGSTFKSNGAYPKREELYPFAIEGRH